MVLIICTKNELNPTNRYWDMVLDRRMEGCTDDAKTISLRLCRGGGGGGGGKKFYILEV